MIRITDDITNRCFSKLNLVAKPSGSSGALLPKEVRAFKMCTIQMLRLYLRNARHKNNSSEINRSSYIYHKNENYFD